MLKGMSCLLWPMNLISKNMKPAEKSLPALHGLQAAATPPVQVVEIEEKFYQLGPAPKVGSAFINPKL